MLASKPLTASGEHLLRPLKAVTVEQRLKLRKQLTVTQVKKIRTLARQGIPCSIIQDNFPDISYQTVYRAAMGYTYLKIKYPPPVGVPWPENDNPQNDSRNDGKEGFCQRCTIRSAMPLCKWCREEGYTLS